jgi:hypothetical protein
VFGKTGESVRYSAARKGISGAGVGAELLANNSTLTSVKSLSDTGGVEAAINITENGCTYLTESFSSFRISALELQHLVKISLFHYLPEALRELAELRLAHPEYSLRELGEGLTVPVSRSGVNHRLTKLVAMAAGDEPGEK